ncbi:hypothetical protein ACTGXZ_10800, partial [Streptococcus suis]
TFRSITDDGEVIADLCAPLERAQHERDVLLGNEASDGEKSTTLRDRRRARTLFAQIPDHGVEEGWIGDYVDACSSDAKVFCDLANHRFGHGDSPIDEHPLEAEPQAVAHTTGSGLIG